MWRNIYKDFPQDGVWHRERVESGRALYSGEMQKTPRCEKESPMKPGWLRSIVIKRTKP